ncbi:MAG: hypothetical protein ACLFVU_02665 [Phycisphaerae bacterium]
MNRQNNRPKLHNAIRAAGGIGIGGAIVALGIVYLSIASTIPDRLASVLGTRPEAVYRHWIPLALAAALVINVTLATVFRLPRRVTAAGAYLGHIGVIVLAVAAVWYTLGRQSGTGASIRISESQWSVFSHAYTDTGALYVRRADQTEWQKAMSLDFDPLGSDDRGPDAPVLLQQEDAVFRVKEFRQRTRLVRTWRSIGPGGATNRLGSKAVRLAVSTGGRSGEVVLREGTMEAASLPGLLLVRLIGPALLTASVPEDIPVAWIGIPEDGPAVLELRRNGKIVQQRPMKTGETIRLETEGEEISLRVVEVHRNAVEVLQAAAPGPPGDPLTGPALRLRGELAGTEIETWVPYVEFPQMEQSPTAIPSPDGAAFEFAFSRDRFDLPGQAEVISARRTYYTGTMVVKDLASRIRIRSPEGAVEYGTITLNSPVSLGPYQLSQGQWLPEAGQPEVVLVNISSKPGLWLVWVACGLTLSGLVFAFVIKPILVRRKGVPR